MFVKKIALLAFVCLVMIVTGCGGGSSTSGASGPDTGSKQPTTIGKTAIAGSGWYPRVIRLSHGPAAYNGRLIASTGVGGNISPGASAHGVFQSLDSGATFSPLGSVVAAAGSSERCCSTLFELPVAVGTLPAGTLLSAGSYNSGTTPAIEVYISKDEGETWSYYDTPAIRGAGKKGGLWEPEFSIASDGALVMFWSDETDPCCSQKIVQIRTYDGHTWQDMSNTVALLAADARPGMARVSTLPNGHHFMSYEVCGSQQQCTAYSRTSTDGWNYGTPSTLGNRIVSSTGQYFEHAPDSVWTRAGGGNGALLAVGQMLYEADGTVSPSNGRVLFVNTSADGAGVWTVKPAPVPVPNAYSNPCPNYADTLLPSADGAELLELAADFNGSMGCQTYYGTLPQ
ncbi:sialidase family protein [Caballeronia sp. LZ035]|uniref:sialidase family protein n=1 Tax=Caballeronia sp. LZ035 TaxID=3038568 RepID=UPI00285B01BD|nr:sialidase family protein [Caballeronia sp. LZ035]MDR5759077.1 sialidase family protein [Caballeronia sp. LZ035]